ncbi:hypothetical protein BDV39DRAFT_204489 [Aspergillus sergii]|uniref:AMP-dependent synthetase/ligase domain-containing protein n=1 Tax=Aspergillus sergii TaxID=1034303 RepID=A0A5N6X868_9EURO|nr:hypothetical protein BDV39DRAFT_204489 [Aspergillus sergii]
MLGCDMLDESGKSFIGAFALSASCCVQSDCVSVDRLFDEELLPRQHAPRIAEQFLFCCQQHVASSASTVLKDITLLTPSDALQIREWNRVLPEAYESRSHDLFKDQCLLHPQVPALSAWDGLITYNTLSDMSTVLAVKLQRLRICPEDIVPVYFEKSKREIVSLLAVMKAGAAFTLLDRSIPTQKAEGKAQRLNSALVIAVNDNVVQEPLRTGLKVLCTPRNALYAVFTSGSPGAPKGVVVEHQAFCSSLRGYLPSYSLGLGIRVLQISSYTIHASTLEILGTLCTGACLCIPTQADIENNLAATIVHFDVNWLHVTPSLLRVLNPSDVPSALEELREQELDSWRDLAFSCSPKWPIGRQRQRTTYPQAAFKLTENSQSGLTHSPFNL